MMTDDEIIAVVQAHKQGKRVESRSNDTYCPWMDVGKYESWDFQHLDYRVAPEPPTEELCPCCGNPRKCEPRKPRELWVHPLNAFSKKPVNSSYIRVLEVIE